MQEKGFYHPSRGYWQTNSEVPDEILIGYPDGTVEVPLKPGQDFDWIDGQWVSVPPPPAPVPQELSLVQFIVGLTENGWITKDEAKNWLSVTSLPVVVENAIASLPTTGPGNSDPHLRARARALRPSSIQRNNELLAMMAQIKGATDEQLDDLFRVYSQI
nr:MAG TPA: hypothetical protein [Caudoviricetes sp.]